MGKPESDLIARLAAAEFAELDALNRLARAPTLFRLAPEWRDNTMSNHRWSEPDRTDPQCTLRTCKRCGMRKMTHHAPGGWPRHTFASADGLGYHADPTPPCIREGTTTSPRELQDAFVVRD